MDSSPDLSLKLRRGSSDSRDSFYMDFAQGIDSDIEEVDTTVIRTSMNEQQLQQLQQLQHPVQAIPSTSPQPTPPPPPPPPPPPLPPTEFPPLPLSPSDSDSPPSILDHRSKRPSQPSLKLYAIDNDGHQQLSGAGSGPVGLLHSPISPQHHHHHHHQQQQQQQQYHYQHYGGYISPEAETMSVVAHPGHLDDDSNENMTGISAVPSAISDTSSFVLPLPPPTPLSINESTVMDLPSQHPPSPISPGNILVSSETVSHNSSPAKSSRVHSTATQSHRVTIDDPKQPLSTSSTHHQLVTIATGPPSPSSSNQHLASTTNITASEQSGHHHHLALMYHHSHHHHLHNFPVLPITRRPSRLPDSRYPPVREIRAGDALATTFSALYGKLLVVMGIAFPMAEVISTYIPPSFYEGFYLYLYIGSMLFLFFMYATLLWGRPKIISAVGKKSKSKKHSKQSSTTSASDSMDESDTSEESGSCHTKPSHAQVSMRRPSLLAPLGRQHHYGSFYLRMGAVAFGIGSMIYSGLEFGQYFELERDTKCHNVMLALTPATRMAFIFIQMYFIFLNNEQIKVYRHKILARFGLMHMIGTNLSVWLNVLIQETKHEILTFYNPENRTLRISHRLGNRMHNLEHHSTHLRVARGLKGPYQIFECRRTNIIGTLVQDASPFLFPCTIEYSLICAAILYVMWRSISRPTTQHPIRLESGLSPCKRSPHHYSVDCARAHKGLFIGILILVLTIISLILFFVLISRPEFVSLAVTEVTICELTIYATATIATLIGMVQIRHLQYDAARSFALDDILLVGAQTGSFLYSTFTVIGGHFTLRRDTVLVLITALASIVQTAFQTMFILDASRRQAVSPEHIRKKPGREIVTFMLVANLAMWAISTLEKSRAESHPIQLNFYGLWAWTIITHVSMPLAIFYRFHSTVCLCEIWKRAYKLKPAYM